MMQLSYSAADKLIGCEQKWAFEKVLHLPVDPDASTDTIPLRFGSAFHSIHEWCEHELGYFEDKEDEYISKALAEQQLSYEEHACILHSCVKASLILWKQTGLRIKACEVKIEDEDYVGYVDFVAICPTTESWWIGDLKTTGRTDNISARLYRDPQLSLYCFRKELIAAILGLDVKKFQGALYRETIKPKIVVKKGEKPAAFSRRAIAESQIYIIKAEDISDAQVHVHKMLHARAMEIAAGRMPLRNYKNCLAYNKRCEYWSRCYGKLGSECASEMLEQNTMFLIRGGDTKTGTFKMRSFSLAAAEEPAKTETPTDDIWGDFL